MSQIVFDLNICPVFTKPKDISDQSQIMVKYLLRTAPSYSCPQDLEDSVLIMKQHPHQYTHGIRCALALWALPHQVYISVMQSWFKS